MRPFVVLFLLVLFHYSFAVRASRAIRPKTLLETDENYALHSIKAAITNDSQAPLSSWNTSTDHCTWVGVTCDSHRHIIVLDLSGLNLTGTLSPDVSHLPSLLYLSVAANSFSGPIPGDIGRLQQLSKLDLSQNSFSGSIAPGIGDCKSLTYVDFSRNQLTGEIPNEITGMRILNYLNLSRNHLVGGIPDSLLTMQSLTCVDFSYNNLSGLVHGIGQLSYLNSTSFIGNPSLCGPYLGPCEDGFVNGTTPPPHEEKQKIWPIMFVGFVLGGLILFFVGFCAIYWWRVKRIFEAQARAGKVTTFDCLWGLTTNDVLACLKTDNIIGKGSSGSVYKGIVAVTGVPFALKRLPVREIRGPGFTAKIQTLGEISRHMHTTRLLGICSNPETVYLLYRYKANGSLGDHLHSLEGGGGLLWDTRFKIAVGAAKGLCFLHNDCSPIIVHGNLKSNNILLDEEFNAYVADFGFAQSLQYSETMSVAPKKDGYEAPEYGYKVITDGGTCTIKVAEVDERSDVYSFGVVLLELVSGRKPAEDFNIVQWATKLTHGKKDGVLKILDPRLIPTAPPLNEVMHVFYVAMLCVVDQADERPTMRSVVQMLSEPPPNQI